MVGSCLHKCDTKFVFDKAHQNIASNISALDDAMCGYLQRTGQHCGRCVEGYGIPVYAYELQCVKCQIHDYGLNVLKYIAVAFIPLTLFYLIVITFKVSATSGSMVGFVLTSQILT